MRTFIKVKTDGDEFIVDADAIDAVNCYRNGDTDGILDIRMNNHAGDPVALFGKYADLKPVYDQIVSTMSSFGMIVDAGEKIAVQRPAKIARKLPNLDQCVLITED